MSISGPTIDNLGPCNHDSPLLAIKPMAGGHIHFVSEDNRVRVDVSTLSRSDESFERAGPRRSIFFDPSRTRAAIVTCGGLCPGLNDVIRSLVYELYYRYGVRDVLGIRYGYAGLATNPIHPPMGLDPEVVDGIHQKGGTILGSSRGQQDVGEMVDSLIKHRIDCLFCIGGDGTLRGAHEIAVEIKRRRLPIAIVGIPKTIDNDIAGVYRSFGFQTAVEIAGQVIEAAHVEAKGVSRGVGLVKLMGRDSGFIAAYASLASGDVNCCLVPEVPFCLEGARGLVQWLRQRLDRRNHAVITVAEGAGLTLLGDTGRRDASGNAVMNDIGLHLKYRLAGAFAELGEEISIKYFDPSYLIRSVRANASDSILCSDMARGAVHAAMAGKTDLLIALWHGVFTHVPLVSVVGRRRKIDPNGNLWLSVLAATGQPESWGEDPADAGDAGVRRPVN